MRLRIHGNLAVVVTTSGVHDRVFHGPQTWPWWRITTPRVVMLDVSPPSRGWRLWIYTRWWCPHVDLVLDRRPQR